MTMTFGELRKTAAATEGRTMELQKKDNQTNTPEFPIEWHGPNKYIFFAGGNAEGAYALIEVVQIETKE